tara:strand:+ start:5520 stop:5936 length:417 start_codon:yes stop_codon:yes gene_type:complete
MNPNFKSIIPTSFSAADDLAILLDELNHQADAVLANVCILQDKSRKYEAASDPEARRLYAIVLREHGEALETDLGIIKLTAGLITDERLEAWIDEAAEAMEHDARAKRLEELMAKLQGLEAAMSELGSALVGEGDLFL